MSPLLAVKNLAVRADMHGRGFHLVEDVTFSLEKGEILGLVGESGSGKSVTCRALLRLLPGANLAITAGEILFEGRDFAKMSDAEIRNERGASVGMIFQNPASHLDPVMSIGDQVAESIVLHRNVSKAEAWSQTIDLLRQVGIPDPERRARNFAHEFSGGMKQRAMIAAALACDPQLLIADEPTTALDVTVQAQILRLLIDLRDRRGLSIILVTHDLGVVAQACDSIAVMYGGRIVERGPKRDVLKAPFHPYTARLIACQPAHGAGHGLMPSIPGQPPTAGDMPPGCRFHPRCDLAQASCRELIPHLKERVVGHLAACPVTELSS
ncbi:ABC transporter ATP-binding protein [Dongia rigui]|uniref:ABC transporter ATP-binding protein n=1 Tax=Dongia rigui TaxID=940149 RepID=A0ABU5DY66_9PROT|nr:ABC transporter ATP-binding protein [Dongia rigui]MDY0872214.1 ABC transporter ATP-binding protein [Dongia rigui]